MEWKDVLQSAFLFYSCCMFMCSPKGLLENIYSCIFAFTLPIIGVWTQVFLVRGYFSTEPVTLLNFPCQDLMAAVLPPLTL